MLDVQEIRQTELLCRNKLKLIRGGKEYFDLLIKLINNATESIHLQTYIYDDDETGSQVATALKAAALRNVSVYLMADGYASQVISQKFINDLRNNGVHFRLFEPLLRSKYFYFGRRLHHKVVVIDARYSLVGGVNITNRYNDMQGKPAWLDFALYADGDISRELYIICWKAWNGFSVRKRLTQLKETNSFPSYDYAEMSNVKIRRNDWIRRKNEISESYFSLFSNARSQITIVCSYFLPGIKLRGLLSKAAARGVKIKILTAGHSDIMLAKHAERWLYDWLLRNNIRILEYQPSILHAKVAICDSKWFTIGSYNVNNISAYASIELNLDVHDPALAMEVEQTINEIIKKDAVPITPEIHKRSTNIFIKLKRWLSYQAIRLVFNGMTFYYRQRS
jgi:cardiolipin synthase